MFSAHIAGQISTTDPTTPVVIEARWDETRPIEVTFVFDSGPDNDVATWTFARDLLVEALTPGAEDHWVGIGDVRCRTDVYFPRLDMRLSTDDDVAIVSMPREQLDWLVEISAAGANEVSAVDAAIEELLTSCEL